MVYLKGTGSRAIKNYKHSDGLLKTTESFSEFGEAYRIGVEAR